MCGYSAETVRARLAALRKENLLSEWSAGRTKCYKLDIDALTGGVQTAMEAGENE